MRAAFKLASYAVDSKKKICLNKNVNNASDMLIRNNSTSMEIFIDLFL